MATRLLLAILVTVSLAASGCSGNRHMCRRMFGGNQGCQCCNQSMCNCGCNSCGCSPYTPASCAMGGCSLSGCSSCQGGSCSMCSGGGGEMYSGGAMMPSGNEMSGGAEMASGPVEGQVMQTSEFGPQDGTYFGSPGTPGCNCGAQ